MGSVNTLNTNVDQTVRIFDQFYNYEQSVPANEYDIVNSFFESVFKTKDAAKNFTTALFRVAYTTDTSVLTLLAEMQDQDQIQINVSLAYYLNGLRSSTTLLGVNSTLMPNYYTARNVVLWHRLHKVYSLPLIQKNT